mgnify:CR=1 FL=1
MVEDVVRKYEQEHLDHVVEEIKKAEGKAKQKISTAKHDIKGINKQIDDIHLFGDDGYGHVLPCPAADAR